MSINVAPAPSSPITVKIECTCGQRYAFDVVPFNGSLPGPVACPSCGADGTVAGNSILAQKLSSRSTTVQPNSPLPSSPLSNSVPAPAPMRSVTPSAVSVAGVRVSVAAPSHTAAPVPPTPTRLPGQMDRLQAEREARAKIMWGDSKDEVIKFLLLNGVLRDDAKSMVEEFFAERAVETRKNGFSKLFSGIGMICLPIVAFITFQIMGVFPIKIFGATLVVGMWGVWRVISGSIMALAPKSEGGDVGAQ